MKLAALSFLVVALTGCAGQVPLDEVARLLPNMPDGQLCYGYWVGTPPKDQMARQEAARRGLDCTPYKQDAQERHAAQLQKEQANDTAMMGLAGRLVAPPQPGLNPTPGCRSYRLGDETRADCN